MISFDPDKYGLKRDENEEHQRLYFSSVAEIIEFFEKPGKDLSIVASFTIDGKEVLHDTGYKILAYVRTL